MPRAPNVVLVMADQLVPFLTGAYGHEVVQTPAMDSLAAEGVRFDAAYTPYPLCAPARAALMTGRHASSFGCFDNAALFPADEPTFAHALTNAGYHTACSGKMHFVGPDQLHGFRDRLTPDIFPAGFDWLPVPDEQGRFPRGGHAHSYVPPAVGVRPWTKFLTYDEETSFRAVEFVRERGRSDSQDPFFLLMSLHHPHDPFHVTQELADLYADAPVDLPRVAGDEGWPTSAMDRWLAEAHDTGAVALTDPDAMRALRRAYYGLVTYVDRKVAQVLQALEETGQLEDTVVIFTSDHGDMLGEREMVQKRCFYEWSARIPLLVRLPGRRHAGTTCSQPVSLLDVAPTLLDLAGVPLEERLPTHGRSLLGLIDGSDSSARVVCSEYHVEKVRAPCFMVRTTRHKYIYMHRHGSQLFDLYDDPDERHDLAESDEHRPLREEMHRLLLQHFDPDRIEVESAASVLRRQVIMRAMQRNGTRWEQDHPIDRGDRLVR